MRRRRGTRAILAGGCAGPVLDDGIRGDGHATTGSSPASTKFGGAGNDTLQASYEPANLLRCGSGSDTIDGVDCERVQQYGLTMSVRPQRRAGGALRFTWSCSHQAADVHPGCLLTVAARLGSRLLASRKVSLASPSSGSFVPRPSRPIRRGTRIDVAISGGDGTRTKVVIAVNARWRVRL